MTARVLKALATFCAGFLAGACLCGRVETRSGALRVLTRCDTVRVTAPARTAVRWLKADTVWLSVAERPDSVRAVLPCEQAEYSGDGYRAYVSGFSPRLDSIVVLRSVSSVLPATRQPRFALGIQAGYGITPRGFQPYIGVGVSYSVKF